MLWTWKWFRPEIETLVNYLIKQESKSEKFDRGKLRRVLYFPNYAIWNVRAFGVSRLAKLFMGIYVVYGIHEYING